MKAAVLVAALAAGLAAFPAVAAATPSPVAAWYAYGSSPADLASYAYARGCDFARNQPGNGLRLMLLDFGAARKPNAGTWGTIDFSNTTVSNADILTALKAAAGRCDSTSARERSSEDDSRWLTWPTQVAASVVPPVAARSSDAALYSFRR